MMAERVRVAAIDPKKWLADYRSTAPARRQQTMRRRAAAYRQAGHAVAAAALSVAFDTVWLVGERGRFAETSDWPATFEPAVVNVAGTVTEALLAKKPFSTIFEAARDDFAGVPGHVVGAAAIAAQEVLRENWSAVEAVAAGLLERGILSEAEVLGLFVISKRKKG